MPGDPVLDDVMIVATELASNAIKHTATGRGGWFTVEITCHGDFVRVAVADLGGRGELKVIDEPLAEDGRGLVVVTRLAMRTGVHGDHEGRVVWADILCEDREATMPATGNLPDPTVYGPGFPQLIGMGFAALAALAVLAMPALAHRMVPGGRFLRRPSRRRAPTEEPTEHALFSQRLTPS